MKKWKWYFVVAAVLISLGVWWSLPTGRGSQTLPAIVTSGYVPYTLVQELSGGKLAAHMLLPAGAEPHGFEPSPGSLVAVHRARAFVYVSAELEPWVKDVLDAAGPQTRVLELATYVAPGEDPHIWMDFDAVRNMARAIVDLLSELDPESAPFYRQNLEHFNARIAALDKEFSHTLAACQSREVVHIGHLAFGPLAKRYHLTLQALAGTSHEGEHAVRKVADLVKHIRASHVKAVFTEDAVSARLAQAVAAETSTELLPLYTVEHLTKKEFAQQISYEDFMRRNLESLQRGLACRK